MKFLITTSVRCRHHSPLYSNDSISAVCPFSVTHIYETIMSTKRTPPLGSKTNDVKRKRTAVEEIDANEETITLDTAVQMLMKQFTETKTLIDEMRNEINIKIDTVKTELEGKLNVVSNDIHALKTECASNFQSYDVALNGLHERVDEISSTMDNLVNRNELIISGIPYLGGEDLPALFKAACKQLGMDDRTTPSVDIRRLKAGVMNDGDNSLVLVQFALRNQRDDFYSAYLRRRDLQLSHLGIESTRRVYVNENLTVAARRLKAAAVRLKKAGKLSSVYTKLGTVVVKPTATAKPIVIQSEEQLNQFS